jgi:ABC-2 type transport system permease protein
VLLSPAYVVLLMLGVINSAAGLWLVNSLYGTQIHPVTRVMVTELRGDFGLFAILISVYYAGDLVWRERDRNTHELVDSTPLPDWAFVVPKTLAIGLVLVSTLVVSILTAMVVQALRGHFDFEIGKYALWYLVPRSIDFILIAALAVFVQAIVPHKLWGWGVMALFIVSRFVLPNLGLEHFLYRYGQAPEIPLSDMNGEGRFWIGPAWFRLYWSAFALILLVLAYGLWRRGVETRLLPRLQRLPHRLASPAGGIALAALVVVSGSGAWIYYNTAVLNPYRSLQDDDRWTADFEKALLRYETTPQPKIVDVKLDVDIQPRVPSVTTRGVYVIENRTSQPLREIHVRFPRDLVMRSLSIEGARPKITYDRFNYRIFAFDTPMAPGEERTMAFETVLAQRGFKNDRNLTGVVGDGTFVTDRAIAPSLGMDRSDLLQDRRKRARYGLPRELRMPRLGTPGADQVSYVSHDSDWISADVRVSTDADQIPIAPGQEVYERVAGGRRTAEFRTTAPILRAFSIQSARYRVRRETYKGLDLAVFYDRRHPWNVDRMMTAMKASLDYDQANFSPYQFGYMRFLEFPQWDGRFAESFAGTTPWSEDLGFIADLPREGDQIDYVTYVGAHEIAHQWWAHQVIGADEQGSTLLSETLAQYSALMVMKHMYGPDMIRRFLKYELDRYLRARGGDVLPEQPLETVENQDYIHYRKGSLVMYRLQDEIGEDAVNRALRRLLATYAFKGPPYPTSRDLIADIRAEAPPDKQALITDLFEKITLYDLKTTRAVARRRRNGGYDVTLTVSAKKLYADGAGKETEAPMDETLDVGLFDAEPGKTGFDKSKVIEFTRAPIHSGVQTIHLVSDKAPRFAGVDPYNKLIDRNGDDNTIAVGR